MNKKISASLVLIILACISLAMYSSMRAEPPRTMFPDGISHDFGLVLRGPVLEHSFRVVNTSNVPLSITSVRVS